MKEKIKLDNSLIKRNNLIILLKKNGIKRFNKDALKMLEQKLKEKAEILAELLSRKLMLEGRKTLKEEDVQSLDKNAEERAFEI